MRALVDATNQIDVGVGDDGFLQFRVLLSREQLQTQHLCFHALRHLVNADSTASTVCLCPCQVDVLNCVVRKDGRAQSQVFPCFLFHIDQRIAVRNRRRDFERLLHEFHAA